MDCILAAWDNLDLDWSRALAAWSWHRPYTPTLEPLPILTGYQDADILDTMPDSCVFVYSTTKGSGTLSDKEVLTHNNRLIDTTCRHKTCNEGFSYMAAN